MDIKKFEQKNPQTHQELRIVNKTINYLKIDIELQTSLNCVIMINNILRVQGSKSLQNTFPKNHNNELFNSVKKSTKKSRLCQEEWA